MTPTELALVDVLDAQKREEDAAVKLADHIVYLHSTGGVRETPLTVQLLDRYEAARQDCRDAVAALPQAVAS